MNILILSRRKGYYSTQRLCQAARRLKHRVQVVDPLKCIISLEPNAPRVYLAQRELKEIDVIIPRPGIIGLDHALAVVRQFELQGIPVANKASAIALAKHKLACLQTLAQQGLLFPKTLMARSPKALRAFISRLGGTPLVLKFMQGSQGTGVILAETPAAVSSTLDATLAVGLNIMLQQFITEAGGQDIRILVVGDKVIAAMKRYPRKDDFRSNIHQGGWGEPVTISNKYKKVALHATKALGLQIAGVDIMESAHGPMVIEVNASPGFQELERITKIDIAGAIIRSVTDYAQGMRNKQRIKRR